MLYRKLGMLGLKVLGEATELSDGSGLIFPGMRAGRPISEKRRDRCRHNRVEHLTNRTVSRRTRDGAVRGHGLGCTRQALSRLLNGKAGISPAMALALERIGWSNASFWMRLQAAYELAQERRRQAA